ncbi:MAG: TonB-dependent receptor [Ignavibacteriales bacterium]|nr:MAG: TonB-dependent receptor [Ignavibacteriales bacterium]
MKLLFTLFISLLCSVSILSQTKISGTIKDKSNQPLPGANIFIKDSYDGVSSSVDGTFTFTSEEEGEAILVASFVGYKTFEQKLLLDGKPQTVDIVLEEETTELGAVTVSAGSFEASDEKKAVILRPLDIVTTGADADIYSTLETLPGAQQIGESEGLFVRGGSAAESKTIVDEMIVQKPFYTGVPDVPSRGRFSPFLFKGTIFSTGGYSAQYGQALSSVLILKTQDMPTQTVSSINLMALGFGGSHTQVWDNSSLSAEAGYYNLDPYFQIQKQRVDWVKAPESFEGSMNFRYKTSETGMLKAFTSYSYGDLSLNVENLDQPDLRDFFRMKGGNYFLNTNYREIFDQDWVFFSGYSFSYDFDDMDIAPNRIKLRETLNTGKVTITRNVSSNLFLTGGGEVQNIIYQDVFNELEGKLNEVYLAGFLESDIIITNDIALRLGVRGERSKLLDKINVAPRISLAYRLGTFDQLNFAYGQFYQTPAKDFLMWTRDFDFEKATHYIVNYQYIGTGRTFRIEAYYKDYSQLAKGNVFTHPYFNLPDVEFNNGGKGYAKGIDIFWKDNETFRYGYYWLSYTYLDTKREYLNYPTLAAPPFSTPHTFSAVFKYWLNDITTNVGITYSFATGRPYFNPNNPVFLGDKAKNYHNLSLNFSYITSIFNNFTVVFFSIDNVIGYNNVYGYRYSSDGTKKSPVLAPALRTAFIGMFISLGQTNPF